MHYTFDAPVKGDYVDRYSAIMFSNLFEAQAVAQLREAMEAVASGRPWKGGAACRQQCFLFCLITKSRFVAANDTALNTLRPIRPCFTANNNQLGL